MDCMIIVGAKGFIGSNLFELSVKKLKDDLVVGIDPRFNCGFKKYTENSYLIGDSLENACENYGKIRNLLSDYGAELKALYNLTSPCSNLEFEINCNRSFKDSLDNCLNSIILLELINPQAKLVIPSSGNVYKVSKFPHAESEEPEPTNSYGLAKLYIEKLSKSLHQNTTIFRIFLGYGWSEKYKRFPSVIYKFVNDLINGIQPKIWGDGNQVRDCVSIDDIANVLLHLGYTNPTDEQIVNICTGVGTSYNKMISIINDTLNTGIQPKYVDRPNWYVDYTVGNPEKLKSLMNIEFTPVEKGIKDVIDGKSKIQSLQYE